MLRTPRTTHLLLSTLLVLILFLFPSNAVSAQETAEDLAAQAQHMIDSGNLEAARDLLIRAIEIDPGSADLYARLGDVYDQMGDCNSAIEAFTEVLKLNPDDWRAHMRCGDVYTLCLGQHKLAIQEYAAVLNTLSEADPDRVQPLYNRARAYNALGEYLSALQDIEAALSLMPDDKYGYFGLIDTLILLRRFADALTAANQAITLDSGDAMTWFQRARVYWQYGLDLQSQGDDEGSRLQFNLVLLDLDRALEIATIDLQDDVHLFRADVLMSLGRMQDAMSDYQQSETLNNQNPEVYKALGNLYTHHLQEYEQAIEMFSRALELFPDDPGTLVGRAYAYSAAGDFDSAEDDLLGALELAPDESWVHKARGDYFARRADFDSAVLAYDQAIQIDTTNSEAWIARARAYVRIGFSYLETEWIDLAEENFGKAVADYSQVITLAPPYVIEAYRERAEVNYQLGRYDAAVADFEVVFNAGTEDPWAYILATSVLLADGPTFDASRALELALSAAVLAPDLPDVHENLGNVYYERGQYQEALYSYQQCHELLGESASEHLLERIAELEDMLSGE